jgi:hypothetical protein
MTLIRELLARDLSKKIEEIVKVDQVDEDSVYTEITEYIVTDRISDQYRGLLKAMAEAPAEPHEGIGVWISGFFGSGKSSFAKNLGYALQNPMVKGRPAAELFKAQFTDRRVGELLDSINTRIPSEAVMFDVSVDRAVRKATERIAEIMYTVLLRELDYAEDYDVAELEIELEKEGKLSEFQQRCVDMFGIEWRKVRTGAQKISRASAVLSAMDARVYPSADSWARSIGAKAADITVGKVVSRTFELCARRRPGKALVFVIDEVGQYVARSADKIEDLRAVVEQFGKESKNRVKAKQAIAPVWIVVTSQEKLDEVVSAIDSRRVEVAKLQDRFKHHVDLAPADIREVATRRVLAKKAEALPLLRRLFADNQGQLNAACRLERTTRKSEVVLDDFVQFYPYLPHYVELSIDIMSGIRLQPGAPRHLGGSNRTIIKQAYEMLVSERTHLAAQPVGALVTLDKVFELVEGNLSTEKQKDLSDIAQRFKDDPVDKGWALRTAKAVCLLEFVRDLPRTPVNIAAMLVAAVDKPAPVPEVQAALERLRTAQFVRETEEGFKLQTAQEKNWDTERRTFLEPKPKDRNEITREILGGVFTDPKLRTYHLENRSFKVGISVDGVRVGDEGHIPLSILVGEDSAESARKLNTAYADSRHPSHQNELFWLMAMTPEIDDLVADLYASRQMVTKYEQLRAQNRITNEEGFSLASEKNQAMQTQSRLQEKVKVALQDGSGMFRGVSKDGSSLGQTFPDSFKKFLDWAVPDLYPKLHLGAVPLKGTEAEEVLKAANLNSLPQLFYAGPQGLNLIVREGTKFLPNPNSEIAKEVADFLRREHSYGNKVTGRVLEDHFSGIGFGWDLDVLRVVLAVLLRAGAIEVTHQGRRFRSHQDPQCRVPFANTVAFRAASFAPRETVDLKTLTTAVENFEALTGGEVDVEEAAIATALKKLADDETKLLLPVEATARANGLPVLTALQEYKSTLETVQNADSDDCVRILAGEGKSLRESRDRVRQIRDVLTESNLHKLANARRAWDQIWPVLSPRPEGSEIAPIAEQLRALLESKTFYGSLAEVSRLASEIVRPYRKLYENTHDDRSAVFTAAIEDIKGRKEWTTITDEMKSSVLSSLLARGDALDLPDAEPICRNCKATIAQMESDIAALNELKGRVLVRLQELTAPEQRVERVRLAEFFSAALDSEASIDEAIRRLSDYLHKLIAEGARILLE